MHVSVCLPSLVCMIWVIYVHIDTVFGFYGGFGVVVFYCLVGCFSMIVRKPAVLSVLYACVLYFCICTCSAQLSMLHLERHSRNMLIIIIIFFSVGLGVWRRRSEARPAEAERMGSQGHRAPAHTQGKPPLPVCSVDVGYNT